MPEPLRNDQDSMGLFSAPPSIHVGAQYVTDKAPKDPRCSGMQFKTSPAKRGKTYDVTFSNFVSMSVGTPYIELGRLQQRQRNENAKKQLVPVPFIPSNPSLKSSGSGAYYGTFGHYKNMKTTDDYDKRPAKKGEASLGPRNILTSPAKRGTYGFVGLNMGGKPEGVMGEFKYQMRHADKPRPATADHFAGQEKPKPFVPSSPAKKGTYGYMKLNINGADKPHGFNGEYSYTVAGLATDRREKFVKDEVKPFYPSQPPKKGGGYYGTMKWEGQEYKEDPEGPKWEKMMAERKANREKFGNLVFRPSSKAKSMRTVSICNHPRNQEGGHPAAVNAKIYMSRLATRAGTA